jgi:hypothetical protein
MRSALVVLAVLLVSCSGGDDDGAQQVPDTQAPDVDIIDPDPGSVTGTVVIRVAAFDNRGVVGVLTFIDGVQFGDEDTAAPYEQVWNTSTAINGAHILTATARDAAGYVGTSPEVRVVVSGGVAP